MIKNTRSKKENGIKKLEKIAKTRMAVYIYIYIYIVYCHLENKKAKICKFANLDKEIKDRIMLIFKESISLSLCVLYEEILHKSQRAGPYISCF